MAGKGAGMKLFEHPDFDQFVLAAAEHFTDQSLRPAIIEKDYYVTEALRIIANTAGDKTIFKGGTSLSKGWNLIERFSEDIDIFLDPLAFVPPIGTNAINRELKKIRDAVAAHAAFTHLPNESQTVGGFGRCDRFSFPQRLGGPGEVAGSVLLEIGTASGREPTVVVKLNSYLAQFLAATVADIQIDDFRPFPMRLLHFRRTFVEKLFAIHSKIELMKRDKQPLGGYARHYYDLFQLAAQPEVLAMLRSEEYSTIKADYDRISRQHFPKSYFFPDNMTFANSDAIYPSPELSKVLGFEYERQCKLLCYGRLPSWAEVRSRFDELKDVL